jgi:predicted  nucleic acid-binding Zn-ribbon protein
MDTKEVLRQISELEREKAQVELLVSQLKEQKADLEKRMKDAGVSAENLDDKIAELESKITEQMAAIRGNQNVPAKREELGVLDI